MGLFMVNILLGLSLSLPIGTVTVEMMKQGLKNGFLHGWSVGLGAITIDISLILLIYFGFSNFFSMPLIQLLMWLAGCLFLLYLGVDSIEQAGSQFNVPGERSIKSFGSSYLNGLLVAISPGNIIFWMGIFGAVLANTLSGATGTEFIVVAMGIVAGICLHDIGLMMIVSFTRKFLSETMIKRTSVIAGVLLIGFSAYFGYRFFRSLIEIF
ncbi:MAG: LysE family transporter [Bacillus sp. (in: firmicutes)]